ncbi:MAG: 5'-3' exonuclease H3TH domain-containing protein [Myxococcales bacterium]|nr:5'-3' exonuclease H3TH domain-containing protein [Myxococcales bacterium]MDP3504129.1 5'-3' exonuclease H3TH domain-containing protein [Myxococcales bacterium]
MRVHVVDGTFELFRAHYAPRPSHVSPAGKDLKATVGVVGSMLALLSDAEEAVTHLAVAFDNPIRSFRNELFAGYKTEEGMDPALAAQFDDIEQAVVALGVTVWSMKEFECDDALATAAVRFAKDPRVTQVRVMTPDKDLGQVLEGERIVQVDRMRKRLFTEATLRAERGFGPKSIPDFLALVGDTADGIPGLEGFGEKGAAAVLSAYPHLEDIPADGKTWSAKVRGAEKLAATLAAHRAEATLYRTLATLRLDVPLKESLEQLEWKGAVREAWSAWCTAAGIEKFADRPKRFR